VKVVVASFADEKNFQALTRIREQGSQMSCIDSVQVFSLDDLDGEFRAEFGEYLSRRVRGFGYFVWKPQVVLQVLRDLEEGDVVNWVDAGCHLNTRAVNRYREYVELCVNSPMGVLVFSNLQGANTVEVARGLARTPSLPNSVWTKGDLFDHFGVRKISAITEAEQAVATSFFIQKRPETVKFVEDWLQVYRFDFSLCDDSPSRTGNLPGFTENRYDQSIFSLLCWTRGGFATACLSEVEWQSNWELLADTPIHARRDLNYPWRKRLQNTLRRATNFYRRARFCIPVWHVLKRRLAQVIHP
jgi:hypothetical protein